MGKRTWVAAGLRYSCALSDAGATWCWGEDPPQSFAQPAMHPTPTLLDGAPAFRDLAVGSQNGCGLTAAGGVWCWGSILNTMGQSLGSDRTPAPIPAAVAFTSITVGDAHACALDAGGTTFCWGGNRAAQLGSIDTPVRAEPKAIPGISFSQVATAPGAWSTCGIIRIGVVHCWGLNAGALGRDVSRYWVTCYWGKGSQEYACNPVPKPVLQE